VGEGPGVGVARLGVALGPGVALGLGALGDDEPPPHAVRANPIRNRKTRRFILPSAFRFRVERVGIIPRAEAVKRDMRRLPQDAFPPAIETPRLRLHRPERDEQGLLARLIFEAETTSGGLFSVEQARLFGSFSIEHWERYGFGFLVVEAVERTEPEPIGHAGFKYVGTWPGHWGDNFERIELGYAFVPAARGRGYATEAGRALLRAAFAAFDVATILGRCRHENTKSAEVLLRCGMTELEPDERDRRFEIERGAC
jgi:RimJ/RimL family protein N-acetyltransferase